MCGIAGIISTPLVSEPSALEAVERMIDRMRLRGPDAEGVWSNEGVVLGHRRLAILDLDARANQPMVSPRRTLRHRFQRRDLQLPRAAPGLGGGRSNLSHHVRYRSPAGAVRPRGRAHVAAAARHVRLRHLGYTSPRAVPGA